MEGRAASPRPLGLPPRGCRSGAAVRVLDPLAVPLTVGSSGGVRTAQAVESTLRLDEPLPLTTGRAQARADGEPVRPLTDRDGLSTLGRTRISRPTCFAVRVRDRLEQYSKLKL